MNTKYRTVACLTADGFSAAECAKKMKIGQRSVEGIRRRPEVIALVAQLEEDGIPPESRLSILTYSQNENTALRAAQALAQLQRDRPPEPAENEQERAIIYAGPAKT